MSQISARAFANGLYTIYSQKPTYKNGHDSSDGSCDGIGFIRGGLFRGGATKIINMKELNQFARKTAKDIRTNDLNVKLGDILLKSSSDGSMPLPSKYRIGGIDYNGDNVNYAEIGAVVKVNPVTIIHMTKDGLVKDDDIEYWDFICSLPYIVEERKKVMRSATVFTDKGDSVKCYAKPSFSCQDVINIPNGAIITVTEDNDIWSSVLFGDRAGYVLSKFIAPVSNEIAKVDDINREEIEKAYHILGKVLGYE